jgi:hypothetical protein
MARYKRGGVIDSVDVLVFFLEKRELFFHGSAILPSCQVKNWTYNKMKERVLGGHLRLAIFEGVEL